MNYALVCVDIQNEAVDRLFCYVVPEGWKVQPGMRVQIPFGSRSKPIDGYVMEMSETCEEAKVEVKNVKYIASLYEDYPVFSAEMIELAKWMQNKYYTTLANCLKCILPPGLPKKKDGQSAQVQPIHSIQPMQLTQPLPTLTDDQAAVLAEISDSQNPILIHGVTGSGKTEVYMRAIAKVIEKGRQAIMLVPEIALTPQTVSVFKKRFGDMAAVTHSRLTAKERLIQWQKARLGQVSVMIGPRSAIFTPFDKVGIIIIDEEHEHTYRSESSPKFDTREIAIKRAALSKAQVIMGSATPSLESYHQAINHEFKLLKMPERVNGMFPKVHIVDMRKELVRGNTSVFGLNFQDAMAEVLKSGKQIILFLNRRGHSSFISCRQCGHVMGCSHCRVNYTYHRSQNFLLCHYCGKGEPVPLICPACASPHIRYFGLGTQKVEEELARIFPDAVALRMDMDTTKSKNGHAKILSAFRKNEAQILIGTQMIAKGLDFPNVVLVGIIAADLSLFSGDFRAAEHTFSLLTQVSGRAGRADAEGTVFIQTYNPEHYSITLARQANYAAFYEHEITLRRTMEYPPFSHVFMVLLTGPDERALIMALHKLLAIMKYCNKKGMFDMLGPAPAFVSKIKKQFRWKLLVKCSKAPNPEEILKQFVLYCLGKLKENDPLKGIGINLTMNPAAME